MKFNTPSDNLIKTYFNIEHKDSVSKTIYNKWKEEFIVYIKQILQLIYDKNTFIIDLHLSGDPVFFELWKRAFSDETASLLNYEPVEFYGDKVYNYSLSRHIYVTFSNNLEKQKSNVFSEIYNYFKSDAYIEEISENLNLYKWILKGDEYVNMTLKMKSNIVESFFGAFDFISKGVKSILIKQKEYEMASKLPFGNEACYALIKKYFEIYGFDVKKSEIGQAKQFFNILSDIFGARGDILFMKGDHQGTFFKFSISENIIKKLTEELQLNQEQVSILNYLNKNEIFKEFQTNDNEYALKLKKKVFEKKLGITDEWLENYKDFSKVDTIPEPFKTRLLEKVKGNERCVKIRFAISKASRDNKKEEMTIIMYKLKGDEKNGKTIAEKILKIKTGKNTSKSVFPFNLRDELVKEYLSEN